MTDEPAVDSETTLPAGASSDDRSGASTPEADELGERLLEAAAEVFAERGYDKAGVAEIARRAGVTTGAIYARYPGKAELLVEAIDPHAGDELETLFADHQFQGRMEDILLAAGSSLVQPGPQEQSRSSLLLESFVAARRHPDVGEVLRDRVLERRDRLTAIVEAAKADGGIEGALDTASMVLFCHAVGFGFLLVEALDLELPDPENWQALITRLVDALGTAPTSEPTTEKGNEP
ncbi:MAG TPA: helix-turn-helix domain-containing protein [Acidimicrobiales bacterium]|nr:helix-turn-helix domain-containing protein [Acidimicrobiales bacterium]